MFNRKTLTLPKGIIPRSSQTDVVRVDEARRKALQPGERHHQHSGFMLGCTAMAVAVTRADGSRDAYMQHFRSSDRLKGFVRFEEELDALAHAEAASIVHMVAGVLSPRMITPIPTVGPWVTPMSGAERQRMSDVVSQVHQGATTMFSSYEIRRAQRVYDTPHYVRMDLVVPEQAAPQISVLV